MAEGLPRRTDVAVIGGGVVGLACGLELARRGVRVCVLERDRIGHGCSYGNAGWLTPSLALPLAAPGAVRLALRRLLDPDGPFYIRPRADPALARWLIGFLLASRRSRYERGAEALVELCRDSVDGWERLAETDDDEFGFARTGLVAVHESTASLEAALPAAAFTARLGIPFESWSAERLREREPALHGPAAGALFFPDDARCDPYGAVVALAREARRAGATLCEGAEVVDAERDGDRVRALRTTAGPLDVSDVVLAAGAWSGTLGRRLGVRLPMLGAKGYTIVVPPLDPHPGRAIYLTRDKVAINPHTDSLRISGTLELVGDDLSVTRRRVDAVLAAARRHLALPDEAASASIWAGLRPCLPDGMPAIGRSGRTRNLWLATGHQMTGLKTAPATGELLAQLMTGEPPRFDPVPFRPDRPGAGG